MSPSSNSALMLKEIASRTPRPYTSKLTLNGALRTQTQPIDPQVIRSFSTRNAAAGDNQLGAQAPNPRDGETGSNGGRRRNNREEELVSFMGSWADK